MHFIKLFEDFNNFDFLEIAEIKDLFQEYADKWNLSKMDFINYDDEVDVYDMEFGALGNIKMNIL